MKLFRSGWGGLGLLFLGMGSLAACVMQGSQSESEAVRQSEVIASGGAGEYVTGCPSPWIFFPMNRVQSDQLLGCTCTVYPHNVPSRLLSRCASSPSTCGNLYCTNPPTNCPDPAPTYSFNGIDDAVPRTSATNGCPCVTKGGLRGHLLSKCAIDSATCDSLYCIGDPSFPCMSEGIGGYPNFPGCTPGQ